MAKHSEKGHSKKGHAAKGHAATDDGEVHAHISSIRFYGLVFAALIVLTFITYALSWISLGSLNLTLAIVIAMIKSSLVVLYFMHLRWDSKFNAFVFVGSLLFMAVFVLYTMNDTAVRGRIDYDRAKDDRGRYSATLGGFAAGSKSFPVGMRIYPVGVTPPADDTE
ncbi:MAG: cytochrome C oxidase subunit IV family protein [Myxococcota bacterium]